MLGHRLTDKSCNREKKENKKIGSDKILGQKSFGSKKFLGHKKFWVQKKFGAQKNFVQENIGSKKMLSHVRLVKLDIEIEFELTLLTYKVFSCKDVRSKFLGVRLLAVQPNTQSRS